MKNYIKLLIAVMALFILSACGGGGGGDTPVSPTTTDSGTVQPETSVTLIDAGTITYPNVSTLSTDKYFEVLLRYRKNVNDNYRVSVKHTEFEITGCTLNGDVRFDPNPLLLNGNANSTAEVKVSGYVNGECDNQTDYNLKATVTLTLDGQSLTGILSTSSSDAGDTPPSSGIPDSGYALYNITTPVTISLPATSYEIKAQVLKDGLVLSGKEVTLKPFESQYGSVKEYTVKSGADGYANFLYTSPDTLPNNGTAHTITIFMLDDANNTIEGNVELVFNTDGGNGGTNPYSLVNPVLSPAEVTAGNEEINITAVLVDTSTNVGISGETVTITTPTEGSIDSATATTDAAGKVTFVYTAPASITTGSMDLYLRYTKDGITSEQVVTVVFNPASGSGNQFILLNETNLTITNTTDTKALSIDVVDASTGVGVANRDVSITTINSQYGSVSPSTVQTDQQGRATFTYTPPSTLVSGDTTATIRVVDDAGNVITKEIKITTAPPSGGGSAYAFINETNLTVTAPNTTFDISVDLIDSSTGVGVSGEDVSISVIDSTYGSITPATVQTDSSGRATFSYTAPAVLTAGDETATISYTDSSGNLITTEITISVQPTADSGYVLTNITQYVDVNYSKESKEIEVQLIKDGVPVVGESITAKSIPSEYGRIEVATVTTGDDGYAHFTYIAADPLTATNGYTLTFIYTDPNGVEVNATTTLRVQEANQTLDYDLVNVTTPVDINYSGQTETISVYLVDQNGVGVAGKDVSISTVAQGYGSIVNASTVQTDATGKASFTYQAPEDITPIDGDNTSVTLSYTENDITITENVDIRFKAYTASGEYNLTNETTPVVVNYDNEVKNISVYVIDANGVGVPDQNVSIQTVSDVKYGAIISASTVQTDVSGKASFVYEAPADVKAVDGNTTTVDLFMTSNGVTSSKTVEITFNKIEQNVTKPIVVVDNQYKDINLTNSSQSVIMEVRVFEEGTNAPYTQGTVKVKLPAKVIDGVDVGTFAEYNATVGSNGIASFAYTGPQDLASLVDSGDMNSTFVFYHVDNPTQNAPITVHYEPSNDYQSAEYVLTMDGNNTMGLVSEKSFTVYLKNGDALVESNNILELNITSMNMPVGGLVDPTTRSVVEALTYSSSDANNSQPFYVQTNTLSGLLPIEVSVRFTDGNDVKTLTTISNIVVFSGPPTALSISYVGVEHNATIGKFIEKFAVTATDAYNNPVNTQPYIAAGAMVEYAVDGSSADGNRSTTSPRLWHGAFDSHADLTTTGGDQAILKAGSDVFKYIDLANDKVVLFGAGYVYEALGKWDIDSKTSNAELLLKDSYFGSDRSDLYFAVGHNNRQDLCSADGRQYVGNMRSSTYQLDSSGHALIEFEYDYHLTGKDVMVWVNLTGFQADDNSTGRIGEAQKHTLRGTGFVSYESYTIPAGGNAQVTFYVHHKDIPEWYRNGHFATAFEPTSCTVDSIQDSSNVHDARDCANEVGYLIVNVSNSTTEDCTIKLKDESIAVSPEFSGVTYP
jgi:predicted small lipoprotein YifL